MQVELVHMQCNIIIIIIIINDFQFGSWQILHKIQSIKWLINAKKTNKQTKNKQNNKQMNKYITIHCDNNKE